MISSVNRFKLSLLRFPLSALCAWGVLVILPLTAVAQDADAGGEGSGDDGDNSDAGMDGVYGHVTIAGQKKSGADSETDFGLDRMYGGVSGAAGVHGSQVGKRPKNVPEFHVVKKGDTLWDLSENYYGNPWAWPQVWSLNPQIENPHWIYPGDQVRTAEGNTGSESGQPRHAENNSAGEGGFVGRARTVPGGTVFVRDQGYLGDPERDVWGEVTGSDSDQMLLSDGNVVYLEMRDGVDLRIGQRLTVFQALADSPDIDGARTPPGEIVKVYGTVRVDGWDRDTRIAKTSLIESLDIVERGYKVGPVGRRFDVVPPRASDVDLETHLLSGLYPHIYYGQQQLVFVDKGSEDGLVAGNRLRVLRRGDTWSRNLTTENRFARIRVEMGSPDIPDPEVTPLETDDEKYPDEIVGELIVLRTEEYSSICLVTGSTQGLQPGDRAVAVTGY